MNRKKTTITSISQYTIFIYTTHRDHHQIKTQDKPHFIICDFR